MLKSYRFLSKYFQALVAALVLSFSTQANSAIIAIIDSGTDMEHVDIAPKAWWNPVDIPDSGRDEDGNGYPDDTHGWNFAEGNNQVIDYSYLGMLDDDIRKFFDVQVKMMLGEATEEEMAWLQEMVQDEDFISKLGVYGNFMHGTHVGGIAVEGDNEAELLAVKLIPTEVDLPFFTNLLKGAEGEDKSLRLRLVKAGLKLLAKEQSKLLIEIADYVSGHGAHVANGSFGTGYAQASMIVGAIFEGIFRREPTDEERHEVAAHFINSLIEYVSEMADIAPNTLFVWAAGNDGTNNDKYPTSPTNIDRENSISVAATYDRVMIAPFSNYGTGTVHVAAPGLGITNAVPGDKYLTVSGTSQAAPYVANVAGQVVDANKELSPKEVREIIMGTVDVKDFLVGVVETGGIVNGERAVQAARLATSMSVKEAISLSRNQVSDVPASVDDKSFFGLQYFPGLVQPLPSQFDVKL